MRREILGSWDGRMVAWEEIAEARGQIVWGEVEEGCHLASVQLRVGLWE